MVTLSCGAQAGGRSGARQEWKCFFARLYHSWERGPNDNTNGLIRRLYGKKSSFSEIGKSEITKIDEFVNDRPRKRLGWMTPREKMRAFLAGAS